MSTRDLEQLRDSYEDVFDENDQIKNCGRVACMRLIHLMKKYSSADLGNVDTGVMNVETITAEYHRIVS